MIRKYCYEGRGFPREGLRDCQMTALTIIWDNVHLCFGEGAEDSRQGNLCHGVEDITVHCWLGYMEGASLGPQAIASPASKRHGFQNQGLEGSLPVPCPLRKKNFFYKDNFLEQF